MSPIVDQSAAECERPARVAVQGAGPTEAAALAFDPPIPFRWSYTIVQGSGALSGWLLGAAIGPGTLLVIAMLGPAVDLMTRRMPALGALPVRRAEAREC
jgi:uncharacterized membrane protein YczE